MESYSNCIQIIHQFSKSLLQSLLLKPFAEAFWHFLAKMLAPAASSHDVSAKMLIDAINDTKKYKKALPMPWFVKRRDTLRHKGRRCHSESPGYLPSREKNRNRRLCPGAFNRHPFLTSTNIGPGARRVWAVTPSNKADLSVRNLIMNIT